MTLQDIDAFLAVMTWGTYARAAKELFTTAPTIAYHIKQLEQELGFELVKKTGRYVSPTAAGKEFFSQLRDARSQIDRAVASARDTASHRKATLHLGVMRLMPQDALSAILKDFYEASPDDRVVLHEYRQTSYFDEFAKNTIDAACTYESNLCMLPSDAGFKPLWDARIGVAVALDHHFAHQSSLSVSDLQGETIVLPDFGDGYNDPTIEPVIKSVIEKSPVLYSQSHEDAFHHVRIGMGILVTPYATTHLDDTVSFVPLAEFAPIRAGIAYHRDNKEPVVTRFLESVERYEEQH